MRKYEEIYGKVDQIQNRKYEEISGKYREGEICSLYEGICGKYEDGRLLFGLFSSE